MSNTDKSKARAVIRGNYRSQNVTHSDNLSLTTFVHFVIDRLSEEREEWLALDNVHRSLLCPKFKDLYEFTKKLCEEMDPPSPERRTGQKAPHERYAQYSTSKKTR